MIAIMGRRIIVWGLNQNLLFLCEKFIHTKVCRGKMILEILKFVSGSAFIQSHLYQHELSDVISKIMP